MNFAYGMIIISLLIFISWIWRYRVKPHFAKNELLQYFNDHPDGFRLIRIDRFLSALYKDILPARVSHQERKRLSINEDAFVYGEIDFLSFFTILDKVKPEPSDVFYDLGSGGGKAVFSAALYANLSKSCGIELLPGLYHLANARIQSAMDILNEKNKDFIEIDPKRIESISFINENFIHHPIEDADIVFVNATCLSYTTWEKVLEKFMQLKRGSRIIVTTKKIPSDQFQLLYEGMTLMSWGMNSIHIYSKIA